MTTSPAAMVSARRALGRIATALEICAGGMEERYDAAAGALSLAARRLDEVERLLGPAKAGWQALRPRLEALRQALERGEDPDPAMAAALALDFAPLVAAMDEGARVAIASVKTAAKRA